MSDRSIDLSTTQAVVESGKPTTIYRGNRFVRGETVLKYEVVDSKEARRQPRQNAPLINKAAFLLATVGSHPT